MAMLGRLSHRLKKLEGRFAPAGEPIRHRILFVDETGAVVDTLEVVHGRNEKEDLNGKVPARRRRSEDSRAPMAGFGT